jgi:putative transposase
MRPEFSCHENWRKRNLPHYDAAHKYQMITYRLADSLPADVLENIIKKCQQIEQSVSGSTGGSPVNIDLIKYKAMIEKYLDVGRGSCLLGRTEYGRIIIENWHFFAGKRYDLLAYVVMPNHVHLLIKTYEDWPLSKVIQSWKSYTSHKILQLERDRRAASEPGSTDRVIDDELGILWQREYWDRFIRDERHFIDAVNYIHYNPVKAGLVKNEEDWLLSSAAKSSPTSE